MSLGEPPVLPRGIEVEDVSSLAPGTGLPDDEQVEVYRRLGRHLGAHVVGTLLRLTT